MKQTYTRIFRRCGLRFRAVLADSGSIGGSFSQEFMVLAETGEDEIITCTKCDYAANLERAEVRFTEGPTPSSKGSLKPLKPVDTPNMKTVEEVTSFLSVSPQDLLKTLIFESDGQVIAALIRGDHEVNETKLKNLLRADSVALANPDLVADVTGAPMGFAGPVGLKVKMIADHALRGMQNFVTGANKKDLHFIHVNLERDFRVDQFADLRMIMPGDDCPRCGGDLHFIRGIEVGHIFKLGTKYSKPLKAVYLDEHGQEKPIVMGTYGIGVARIVAAAIEQNHDKDGIIFPIPIAPFEVVILPLQMYQSDVVESAQKVYRALLSHKIDVLLDDRDLRPGIKFKDADLLGIPIRITFGEKSIKGGNAEMKVRPESQSNLIPLSQAPEIILGKVKELYGSTE
jgi:prolyl-tRNA synthetase